MSTTAVDLTSSSLEALQQEYLVITSNLANASTAGYKRRVTAFSEVLSPMLAGGAAGAAGETGRGMQIQGHTRVDFSQGALRQTERSLDVAISGQGFLVIETADGPLYTRNGSLHTSATGQLVTAGGHPIQGVSGPIVVPAEVSNTSIQITSDGTVLAGGEQIGQLRVVDFEKPEHLEPVGECAFRAPTDLAQRPPKDAVVCQGFLEDSNVSPVKELVGLITVSRTYEANLRTVNATDDRMKSLLQVAMS